MDALKISKEIISVLESNGLKIDNVYRTNGYFLFNLGENSVTHFKLRNRRWKFGIWITEGEESGSVIVELFGEHIDNIDKFKPSYTKISFGIFLDACDFRCGKIIDESFLSNHQELQDYIKILQDVQSHPLTSYKSIYELTWKEVINDKFRNFFVEPVKKFFQNELNFAYCQVLKFVCNFFNGKTLVASVKDNRGVLTFPKFELAFRHYDDDNSKIYRRYRRWFGSRNIGFGRTIRVNHYMGDEKRGFYYDDE